MKKVVIFGTGEIGELAHYYFENDSDMEVIGFTADDEFVESDSFRGLPLVPVSEVESRFPPGDFAAHVALSFRRLNQTREEKYALMKSKGYELVSYVCSKSVFWPDLSIGDNCFVLENQTIQPTVKIGSNVMLWSGNHLGHAAEIRDHAYISSHVVLCGHSVIGTHCFLGVNASVRDFVTVGNHVFVAMDTSVIHDTEDGSVVVGARGETFGPETAQAKSLVRKYFFR